MKKTIIFAFLLLNTFLLIYFWLNGSSDLLSSGTGADMLIALGRVSGLLLEFFLMIEFVLVGRIRVLEDEFGFDKMNVFHRWIGYSLIIFIIAHPLLLSIGYGIRNGKTALEQFNLFLTNWHDVFNALLAVFLLIAIIFTSIWIVRKKLRYETWYFIHLLSYLAVALAFSHQIKTGDMATAPAIYYWFIINILVFGFVLLYRFARPLYLAFRHKFIVEKIVTENDTVNSIYISGRDLEKFRFEAGQYANLTFIAKGLWYTHPFSFSTDFNGKYLRFTVKNLGDFTSRIREISAGARVIIDGPYGSFISRKAVGNKYLLIAGGIGITPLRSLAEEISKKNGDSVLLYANRKITDVVFDNEFKNIKCKVVNIFSEDTVSGAEKGYVDIEKIKRLVPDYMGRDVYLCGPEGMMKFVLSELSKTGFPKERIHYEKFSF